MPAEITKQELLEYMESDATLQYLGNDNGKAYYRTATQADEDKTCRIVYVVV